MAPRVDSLGAAGWKLILGGTIAAATLTGIASGLIGGIVASAAGWAGLLGGGLGLIALAASQAILVLSRSLTARHSLVIALGAYVLALVVVIATLVRVGQTASLDLFWVALGIVAAAVGYLIGVVATYPRLRLLLYSLDETSEPDSKPPDRREVSSDEP